eukprot:TRINITY_DN20459_c0_g1_i1.p1 TRINITY_DN20459_c0_g1~~TRINITY_DN20459_c0_g1_i1.p1  ORF type:complete len:198 (+),score=44.51 TRINITY_DN20459_c0_g1_i1:139-732(+)
MGSYRIAILGVGGVGKSAITIQFIQHQFITNYDPTIEDSYQKTVTVGGTTVVLELMDTAGQEEYSVMRDSYMRTGQGFMLVYSIINRRSFEEIESFRNQTLRAKDVKSVPLVLVGNKCDLEKERKVTREDGENLAKKWTVPNCPVPFFEASAKTRFHIDEAFMELVNLVMGFVSDDGNGKPTKPGGDKAKARRCTLF